MVPQECFTLVPMGREVPRELTILLKNSCKACRQLLAFLRKKTQCKVASMTSEAAFYCFLYCIRFSIEYWSSKVIFAQGNELEARDDGSKKKLLNTLVYRHRNNFALSFAVRPAFPNSLSSQYSSNEVQCM